MEPHAFACETRRARNALHEPRSALHVRLLTKHAAPRYARELADFASPHFNNRSAGPALARRVCLCSSHAVASAEANACRRTLSVCGGRPVRSFGRKLTDCAAARTAITERRHEALSARRAIIERAANDFVRLSAQSVTARDDARSFCVRIARAASALSMANRGWRFVSTRRRAGTLPFRERPS
jgi:hypothetical protein